MASEFLMPKLGLTMEEGTIVEWLVDDGAAISAGMAVLRVETDKVETDVEAIAPGRLHRVAAVGDTRACGEVIAYVLADGEQPPTATRSTPPATTPLTTTPTSAASTPAVTNTNASPSPTHVHSDGRAFISPNAYRVARELGVDVRTVLGTGPGGRVVSEDVEAAAKAKSATGATSPPSGERNIPTYIRREATVATAAAVQLCDLLGIDVNEVPDDPNEGRVTRTSVADYVRARLTSAPYVAPPSREHEALSTARSLPPATQTPTSIKKLTGMRGTIAKRMHSSLRESAQLTLTMDATMQAVVADRERRKGDEIVPGFTDYVIAATARALRAHSIVNSQVVDEGIAILPDIHVGMAVSLDDGLMVPVIRNTDSLTLIELASETRRLASAARSGSLTLNELEGGTFSVSALGMFGVDSFTPVINPPNTAILGVGRLRDDIVLTSKGKVATTSRLTLSLTWDHRVFDGAPAAEFCAAIASLLEDPIALDTAHL